jgi:hypothetical protein
LKRENRNEICPLRNSSYFGYPKIFTTDWAKSSVSVPNNKDRPGWSKEKEKATLYCCCEKATIYAKY